jgi:predicted nucleic acid-binding Zn ribbon protein
MDGADHRHCRECGKQCGADKQYCSRPCREAHEARKRSRRQLSYMFYAAIAVFVVLFLLSFFHV